MENFIDILQRVGPTIGVLVGVFFLVVIIAKQIQKKNEQ